MIPEKVLHQILALGKAWRVGRVDYLDTEREVIIRVEETLAVWAGQQCFHCASKSVGGYDHAPERQWRHLNVCQLESAIVCALPRGQCLDCAVRAPWEGRISGCVSTCAAPKRRHSWYLPVERMTLPIQSVAGWSA